MVRAKRCLNLRTERYMVVRGVCALLVSLSLGVAPAMAGPPNDNCANAGLLSDGGNAFSTVGATTDGPAHPGHPSCDSFGSDQVANDVWGTYTASCTGDLTLTMCEELGGAANYDTRLAVYNPGCPATGGSLIDCNDDDPVNNCGTGAGGFHSTLTVAVTSGQVLLVRIGGFGAGDSGSGNLNIICAGQTTIDDCDGATEIFDGATAIDTSAATTDGPAHPGNAECAAGSDQLNNDIWHTYTASCTGDLTLTLCEELGGSANFDTRIALYPLGCPATDAGLILCNDDDPNNFCGSEGGGFHSTLTIAVTSGDEFLVRIGGWGVGDFGTGVMVVSCDAGPSIDNCADATEIFDGITPVDTTAATTDGPNHPGHASCDSFGFDGLSEDIWHTYVSTCTGDLTVTMCEELGGSADYDTRIAVYNPGCPATDGSLLECNDDDPINACGGGAGGFHSTINVAVISGQELLIRVGGFNDSGTGNLLISCDGGPGTCGDGIVNKVAEECDGADDAACPGECQANCLCPPDAICGDNIVNQAGEDCDGTDDSACPGECGPKCTCPPPPVCGDNVVNQASEQCDGKDSAACPGACLSNCTCPPDPTCGDGIVNQKNEECDGSDDAACPGECGSDCTCPGEAVPTVSQWGLIAMALMLLVGTKIYFGRRGRANAC